MVLLKVGPLNRAPSVRATMLLADKNGASPPKDPRLSPKTTPEHGVVVAHVPWARPGAKCTYVFEDTCAWLAAHAALSVVTVFLRLAWRTVADIVARVVADGRDTNDVLAGLVRIGIEEIAYRKGHRYLTVIVDHRTGRLVWAAAGRNQEALST